MKVILLAALVGIIIWYFLFRKQDGRDAPPVSRVAEEKMVACAYCGLNLPESEAVLHAGQRYCCDEHRKLDAS